MMETETSPHSLKLWYLKQYDFFGELKGKARDFVKSNTEMCHFKAKDMIYLSGHDLQVYLLKQGQVKISKLRENGEEVIQDILKPGEIFGSLPLVDSAASPDTEYAQAASDTIVCILSRANFEKLIETYPKLNQRLTKWYGIRMRRFEERLNDLIFRDVKQRMAGFLYRYATQFGTLKNGIYEVKPILTHEEVGLLIGAARQTVTTMLNELKDEGFILPDRKCWKILRVDELKKLAE